MYALEKDAVSVSWHTVEIIHIGLHDVLVSWTKGYGAFTIVSKQTFFTFRLIAIVDPFVIALEGLDIILFYEFECSFLLEIYRIAEV